MPIPQPQICCAHKLGATNEGDNDKISNSSNRVVNGGQLTLGGNETIGSFGGPGGSINLGAYTPAAGSNNSTTSYSGVIAGTDGSLVKTGTGSLTLTGKLGGTSGITVSTGGTLLLNAGEAASGRFTEGACNRLVATWSACRILHGVKKDLTNKSGLATFPTIGNTSPCVCCPH